MLSLEGNDVASNLKWAMKTNSLVLAPKMRYEIKEIIQNAHEYLEQFFDEKMEQYIGILVLAKYFYFSKQLDLPQDIIDLFKKGDF